MRRRRRRRRRRHGDDDFGECVDRPPDLRHFEFERLSDEDLASTIGGCEVIAADFGANKKGDVQLIADTGAVVVDTTGFTYLADGAVQKVTPNPVTLLPFTLSRTALRLERDLTGA